jgi:hypothetical protein
MNNQTLILVLLIAAMGLCLLGMGWVSYRAAAAAPKIVPAGRTTLCLGVLLIVWVGTMWLLSRLAPGFQEIDTMRGPAVIFVVTAIGYELGYLRRRQGSTPAKPSPSQGEGLT